MNNCFYQNKRKKNRSYYNSAYSYLVTHPRRSPAEQGLTLLSGVDAVLSLWYHSSTWSIIFDVILINITFKISQNVTKNKKKSLISPGKIKHKKIKNENENPIILALLIAGRRTT